MSIRRFAFSSAPVFCIATVVCCAPSHADESEDDNANEDSQEVVSGDTITIKNWIDHPRITEVRRAVFDIEKLVAGKKLTREVKSNLCQGDGESSRTAFKNATGGIRKLVKLGGTGDSDRTLTLYYDATGKIRFAFENDADVHGNAREARLYFDAQGKKIWQVVRSTQLGDGADTRAKFTVPRPEEQLELEAWEETQPGAAFDAPPYCMQ